MPDLMNRTMLICTSRTYGVRIEGVRLRGRTGRVFLGFTNREGRIALALLFDAGTMGEIHTSEMGLLSGVAVGALH